jgi:uncharacterized protein (TIGR04141 family)
MINKEVGIYLIEKTKFVDNISNAEIIKEIILKTQGEFIYINTIIKNEYNIVIYNHVSSTFDRWDEFFELDNIDTENESEKYIKQSKSNNYIAFIYKSDNSRLFCITTNRAYNYINKYIMYFFGVCLISYFMKDTDRIRSITYSNIMNNYLGGSEYIGEDFESTQNKYWDRISTNLMAEIDKKRLYKELGLTLKRNNPKVRCNAKDNFTICSKIELKELLIIIGKIENILEKNNLIDKFNKIERVRDTEFILKLNHKLSEKIFDDYKNDELDLCIVHKNIQTFFECMNYNILHGKNNIINISTLPSNKDFKKIFDEININSPDKILELLEEIKVICFNEEGKVPLSDSLKMFLNMSIEYDGNTYVFKNNMWFKLTDDYIKNLNEIFNSLKANNNEIDLKFESWEHNQSESEYIEKYKDKEKYYKLHPRLEDGIEICDILYIDKSNNIIKLLFLKKGFGADTRDLAIQSIMGTKRFLSLIKDEEKSVKFYNKYIASKQEYTIQEFKECIKNFNKRVVLVYKLESNKIEKSNIAKQSIETARNEITTLGKIGFTIKRLN